MARRPNKKVEWTFKKIDERLNHFKPYHQHGKGYHRIRKITDNYFICGMCREEMPEYILIQWKLLNGK